MLLLTSEDCTEDVRRKVKEKPFEATTDNGRVSVLGAGAGARLNSGMSLQLLCITNNACVIKIMFLTAHTSV